MIEKYKYLTENFSKSHLNSYVKEFLEENKDIIEDLPQLYEKSLNYKDFYRGNFTPLLTEALLNANINPLNLLDYVPDYYYYENSKLESIVIPNNIKEIGWNAFEYCSSLKGISLPKSLEEIKSFAFANCFNIQTLSIKNPNLKLGLASFEDFIGTIIFEGTHEQWQHFCEFNGWHPETYRLICKDKVIAK